MQDEIDMADSTRMSDIINGMNENNIINDEAVEELTGTFRYLSVLQDL
jgi:hypothetical protein